MIVKLIIDSPTPTIIWLSLPLTLSQEKKSTPFLLKCIPFSCFFHSSLLCFNLLCYTSFISQSFKAFWLSFRVSNSSFSTVWVRGLSSKIVVLFFHDLIRIQNDVYEKRLNSLVKIFTFFIYRLRFFDGGNIISRLRNVDCYITWKNVGNFKDFLGIFWLWEHFGSGVGHYEKICTRTQVPSEIKNDLIDGLLDS